jgi:hypothetical protein
MAFLSGQTSIGTAATVIDGVLLGDYAGNPYKMHLKNNDNTDSVFLGGADVTISTGYKLDKLEALDLVVSPTDLLYGVSDKAGHVISWLTEPV